MKEGMALVSAMHITAGVYVNDWEDGLISDFQTWLEKLAPAGLPYTHHQTGEDNADAHLKRTIMGHQVIVPITDGKLDLGPWEQIFYAEFDGQRRKRVIVKVMGDVSRRKPACMNRDDRRYPDRPIVGVGAVILVDSRLPHRRHAGSAGLHRAASSSSGAGSSRSPVSGACRAALLEVGETLEAGVAREILEETGLVVDVGDVIEVFDRIMFDDEAPGEASIQGSGGQRVRHHYVLIDYLCRPTGGTLRAGSDVSEAVVADPRALAQYAVTAKVEAVIARALEMAK